MTPKQQYYKNIADMFRFTKENADAVTLYTGSKTYIVFMTSEDVHRYKELEKTDKDRRCYMCGSYHCDDSSCGCQTFRAGNAFAYISCNAEDDRKGCRKQQEESHCYL